MNAKEKADLQKILDKLEKEGGLAEKKGKNTSKLSEEEQLDNSLKYEKWNERGFTNRAVTFSQDGIRYVPDIKMWVVWTGKRWVTTKGAGRCKVIITEMMKKVRELCGNKEELVDFLNDVWDTANKHSSILSLITGDRRLHLENLVDFNRKDHLLNVQNGTIDLTTGELKPHDREDLLTQIAPITYTMDPDIIGGDLDSVRDKFKESLIGKTIIRAVDDPEAADYFMAYLGKALGGREDRRQFLILHGPTATGKSVIMYVMLRLLGILDDGGYAAAGSPNDWGINRGRQKELPKIFGKMIGARLILIPELERGMVLDASLCKSATGGDVVLGKKLYKDEITFSPSCSFIYSANDPPHLGELSDALGDRLRMVETPKTVPTEERDTTLRDKIINEEANLTMNLLVRFAIAKDRGEIKESSSILAAGHKHAINDTAVGRFLIDHLVWAPKGSTRILGTDTLFDNFRFYCEKNNESTKLSMIPFAKTVAQLLKGKDIEYKRTNKARGYLGVSLVPPTPRLDPKRNESVDNPHANLMSEEDRTRIILKKDMVFAEEHEDWDESEDEAKIRDMFA